MKTRVLYHLIRADFLERVRRYSFLVTLAAAMYLAYCCVTGKIVVRLDEYRGVYNSAWLGCVMTLVASTFLSLFGFYIVKNSIQRDQQTRVGRILATTPMTKNFYTVAKTISNFAVLASMVAVTALAAVAMQFLKAEDPQVHLWQLLSPFLLFALPAMAVTGALAVLFETIPGLRGGIGNVAYFFLWTALLAVPIGTLDKDKAISNGAYFSDVTGVVSVMSQMRADLRRVHPEYNGGSALTIGDTATTKKFLWTGLRLSPVAYLSRLTSLLMALFIALVAATFFHRFDPALEWSLKKSRAVTPPAAANGDAAALTMPQTFSSARLTPMPRAAAVTFPGIVLAELKLMLKGHRWWWYAVAAGLFIASVASPLDATREGIAVVALIWPILIWSQMGTREAGFNTGSLIFSAPRSLWRQLPAVWIAGILVAAATNGGLGIRLALARDREGLLAWIACAVFVPSLALALGIWSGTSKTFEAIYTIWWYIGPAHHMPGLDFLGASAESAQPVTYFLLAAGLIVAAFLGRRVKLAQA